MGIVGLGHTGMATAEIALAIGLHVAAYTSKTQNSLPKGIKKMTLDELFSTSDIVSLHCPLTSDTKEIINAERLKQMKSTCHFNQYQEGPLVNEYDLAELLIKVIYMLQVWM